MSNKTYTCDKPFCFFCQEMARIEKPRPELKWRWKTSYEHRKAREFKLMVENYKKAV